MCNAIAHASDSIINFKHSTGGILVHAGDLARLEPGGWINDDLVQFILWSVIVTLLFSYSSPCQYINGMHESSR